MSTSSIIYPTISILRCAKSSQLRAQVDEYFGKEGEYYSFERCTDYSYYYTYSSGYVSDNPNIPPLCSVVVLPGNSLSTLSKEADFKNLFNILTSEVNFVLQVSDDCQKCHTREGKCSDENQSFRCEYNIRNTKKEKPRNIVIKSALATFGTGAAIISILVVPYSDVRKMTDSFKVKVGEGGYGSVYQGTLPNGNSVAVKLLNELKGNGEDLVNELASISKTCHVNKHKLCYGFCF
ncbi:rust resistance kinase Lr10-like protein [Tanacetum coccineum]